MPTLLREWERGAGGPGDGDGPGNGAGQGLGGVSDFITVKRTHGPSCEGASSNSNQCPGKDENEADKVEFV